MAFYETPSVPFSFPGALLEDSSDVTHVHVVVAEFSPRDHYLTICTTEKADSFGRHSLMVVYSLMINGSLAVDSNDERRFVLCTPAGGHPFRLTFPDAVNYWTFLNAITNAKLAQLDVLAKFKAMERNLVCIIPSLDPTVPFNSESELGSDGAF